MYSSYTLPWGGQLKTLDEDSHNFVHISYASIPPRMTQPQVETGLSRPLCYPSVQVQFVSLATTQYTV